MAFIVETGEGLPDATSYVAVASATEYFDVDPDARTAWDALNTSTREQYLMWATRILDQKSDFRGEIANAEQALRWPRVRARTRDGQEISRLIIPKPIKDATCELAKYLFSGNDPTVGQDTSRLARLTVDVIEIEYQKDTSQTNIPSIINDILAGLGFFRVGLRGSAKIVKSG